MAPWAASVAAGGRAAVGRGDGSGRAPPAPGGAPSPGRPRLPFPNTRRRDNPGYASVFGTSAQNFSRSPQRMDGRPARALELDRRVEDDDGVAADAHALARLAQQPAGAAHRDALVDREPRGAGA